MNIKCFNKECGAQATKFAEFKNKLYFACDSCPLDESSLGGFISVPTAREKKVASGPPCKFVKSTGNPKLIPCDRHSSAEMEVQSKLTGFIAKQMAVARGEKVEGNVAFTYKVILPLCDGHFNYSKKNAKALRNSIQFRPVQKVS